MKKLVTLCAALIALMSMAVSASAADYTFETAGVTDYYSSTNYEDLSDAAYRYGETNQIDFDIPELKYGLSQQFLEQSMDSPYLPSGTQYGLSGSSTVVESGGYPVLDYRDADNYKRDNTCVVPELSPRSRKQSSLTALTMANQGGTV